MIFPRVSAAAHARAFEYVERVDGPGKMYSYVHDQIQKKGVSMVSNEKFYTLLLETSKLETGD